MMLFGPKAFQVGTGRNSGVGDFGHTGEVTEEKRRQLARLRVSEMWRGLESSLDADV